MDTMYVGSPITCISLTHMHTHTPTLSELVTAGADVNSMEDVSNTIFHLCVRVYSLSGNGLFIGRYISSDAMLH